MKKIIFAFIIFFLFKISNAQKLNDLVVIDLKSGFPAKGVIIELVPDKYVKLKLLNDDIIQIFNNEIISIKVDEKEQAKRNASELREKQKAELEKQVFEDKKRAELQRFNDSLLVIENQKRYALIESQRKRKIDSLLNQIHNKNYFYLGGSGSLLFMNNDGVQNVFNSLNNIEKFIVSNNTLFTGFNFSLEYLVNFSKKKNISVSLDYSQTKSTIDATYTKFDFLNNSFSLNLGHCFYQKLLKANIGSGIMLVQNQIFANSLERNDILCGQLNYFTIPIYLLLRYSSLNKLSFSLKPNVNLNLINSNLVTSYGLNVGFNYCITKSKNNK